MNTKGKYKSAQTKLDHRNELRQPLDYSFKTLSTFDDLLREKKRDRDLSSTFNLDEEVDEGGHEIVKSDSTALKINNNMLTNWDNFADVMVKLFVDPALTLSWIDLSFNDLKSIDEGLLTLPNLMMLYLHGNNIYSITHVDKLASLGRLKSLTLHGNPMEVLGGYRHYIICVLPQLQTFDFSGITRSERTLANSWIRMNAKKQRSKKAPKLD